MSAFRFYLYSNLHVALAVVVLCGVSMHTFQQYDELLLAYAGISTFLVYNAIRWVQLKDLEEELRQWYLRHRRVLLVLNLLALLVLAYLTLLLPLSRLYRLLPFALITVLYVLPGLEKPWGLRFVPGLKLFLIGLSWAGTTVWFAAPLSLHLNSPDLMLIFLARLSFVMAITIPFDIRDMNLDKSRLNTLPQRIGLLPSKVLSIVLLIVFMFFQALAVDFQLSNWWPDLLIGLLSAVLVLGTQQDQKRSYTAFWVESLPIFWFILTLL